MTTVSQRAYNADMAKALSTGLTLMPLAREYVRLRVVRGEIVDNTAKNMSNLLIRFAVSFGKRNLARLTPAAIDTFLAELGDMAPGTRRVRMQQLKAFCQWLVDTKRIKENPMKGYKMPRVVPGPVVTVPELHVEKLLEYCGDDLRKRAMVWMMVGLGARCCEVANATVDDYDPVARMIRLTGKGGYHRTLPVPPEVAGPIDAYLAEVGRVTGAPLIRARGGGAPGRRGAPSMTRGILPGTVSNYLREWFEEAGIKARPWDGKSAHALRRTAASDVLDRTGKLRAVQKMLGHKSVATTEAYLRALADPELVEAMSGRTYDPSRRTA